jgi:hypothetical protein
MRTFVNVTVYHQYNNDIITQRKKVKAPRQRKEINIYYLTKINKYTNWHSKLALELEKRLDQEELT